MKMGTLLFFLFIAQSAYGMEGANIFTEKRSLETALQHAKRKLKNAKIDGNKHLETQAQRSVTCIGKFLSEVTSIMHQNLPPAQRHHEFQLYLINKKHHLAKLVSKKKGHAS